MGKTDIEWTDKVWNPVTGCTKVSAGCANCYAAGIAKRFWGNRKFEDVKMHKDRLEQPLNWRKPYRVFVNSMSDLLHDDVPASFLAEVFNVMASATLECKCRKGKHDRDEDNPCWTGDPHTFQILTKRAARLPLIWDEISLEIDDLWPSEAPLPLAMEVDHWPLPNVWLGVSVENQKTANERIPLLLKTPAAVRFLSVEPMLERIDIRKYLVHWQCAACDTRVFYHGLDLEKQECECGTGKGKWMVNNGQLPNGKIGWVVCGGESGPGARPFNIEWARDLMKQCKDVGVPFFMKQLGAKPFLHSNPDEPAGTFGGIPLKTVDRFEFFKLKSRKGGNMAEWPEDLRVREFPPSNQ